MAFLRNILAVVAARLDGRRDLVVRDRLSRSERSRLLIVAASVGVVAYSLVVLAAVAAGGDIGLRCVFGRKIKEVGPNRWLPGPPSVGDELLGIDSRAIEDYRDYVKAIRELRRRIGAEVEIWWQRPDGSLHHGKVTVQAPPMRAYLWSIAWFLQEMIVFAVGLRVYWRRPRDDSARLFFWLCVATVGAFVGGYHWSRVVIDPPLIFLFAAFAVFVPIVSLHFYLVFPRPNPYFEAHRRPVLWLLYGVPGAALAGLWSAMLWAMWDPDRRDTAAALYVLRNLALGYVGLAVAVFVLCLACLLASFLRARTRPERNQVQWILLATLLSFFPISYLLWDAWNDPARLGLVSSAWPMVIVSLLYTAAYAISITRYKLMQAEEYLNRGVVYFVVTLTAGLVYSGLLVGIALAINDSGLANRTGLGAIAVGVTALLMLVLYEAARQRVQKVIDRRFFKEKYKFDQAMRKMSQAVGSLVDRATLGRRLLEAAAEVLRLEWGALYLAEATGGAPALVACVGPEPDERVLPADHPLLARLRESPTIRVPHALATASEPAYDALIALGGEVATALENDGDPPGLLVLGPKRSGMPYEDEELAFLGALGSVATLALRSAGIQTTLEALNQDVRDKVEKIAEQQRRILILQDELAGKMQPVAGQEALSEPVDPSVFGAIKGSSRAVRQMLEMARKVAISPSAVLIRGESGTGKELLAEAIHAASPRAGKPFVKVHCAALSQNLLESELFGHVKGAFTGADRDRIGRFQQADGGTLFLDEIGDINWEVQTKLLRVLQEMAFERVGSSQPISVDVRVVAATHQDLEALIRGGRFREDLFYRLNVISIRAPSLRDRVEDIFELAVHFLNVHGRRVGRPVTHLDEAAIEMLIAYDWPGNIRQLENVIERAVVLADGPALTVDDLPAEVRRPTRRRARLSLPVVAVARPAAERRGQTDALGEADDPEFTAYERQRLLDALAEASQNKSEAARLLAMPRSTFFSKLKKYGLA
jgi:DNA-binding NtrC family response regulator